MKRRRPAAPSSELTVTVQVKPGRCPVCRRDGDEYYLMQCADATCGNGEDSCLLLVSAAVEGDNEGDEASEVGAGGQPQGGGED